jgi:hypothetical protein
MWSLSNWHRFFNVVGFVGVLVLCVPSLVGLVSLPTGEQFSVLYILGAGHMAEPADYPFNVSAGHSYTVFLGVENDMAQATYYEVYVKLRNETDSLPNATSGIPSELPELYKYRVFLADNNGTWEGALSFSFTNVTFGASETTIGAISLEGVVSRVNKIVSWDENRRGYYFEVFAELWIYNREIDKSVYNDRYVGIWMNMTVGL